MVSIFCQTGFLSLILRLQHRHVDLFKQETQKVLPVEACALLFGKQTVNETYVEKVEFVDNALQSEVNFLVDPATVVALFTTAEQEGLEFIGLFHSHPSPAVPSVVDLNAMRLWPDTFWVILSSTSWKLAAYGLVGGDVKEVNIIVY